MMIPDERATIQARADAATKGPWTSNVFEPYPRNVRVYGQKEPPTVVWLERSDERTPPYYTQRTQADIDAEFIAHARTDIPTLLAEIDRLEATQRALMEKWRTEGVPDVDDDAQDAGYNRAKMEDVDELSALLTDADELPEPLAISLALWKEDPEAYRTEWKRGQDFKVKLIQENERLRALLTDAGRETPASMNRWPERLAFVEGAKWQVLKDSKVAMFGRERQDAEEEATVRYPHVSAPAAQGAEPSDALWQAIYDAAEDSGSTLHDDTVTAIAERVAALVSRTPAHKENV